MRLEIPNSEEVEKLVVKLAKEGNPPSKIGLILRDQYAVPSVREITGKTVKQILKEHGLMPKLPEDLANVIRKAVKLYDHLSKHKKDYKTKRALEIVESRINRLVRYYKRKGELPPDWRYDREKASLLV
ncbi:MAG: 30S ribosomal protein S15 [Candidatus Hadarchaeales archaeon]